jgi:polysaccharide export outer membrane protein
VLLAIWGIASGQEDLRKPDTDGSADAGSGSCADYRVGANDKLIVQCLDYEELDKTPIAVDAAGWISLPLVGRVQVAGLSLEQVEDRVAERLRKYIRDPKVRVSMGAAQSQRVFVVGAVATPGVQEVAGCRRLMEVLSLSGGLRPEAGHTITITRQLTRGNIPLATATIDKTGTFEVARVSVSALMTGKAPEQNITILPDDVITIPRAELIYVIGAVEKPGGFVLNEREHMTVLQALSLAGGLAQFSSPGKARILRADSAGSERHEISLDVSRILDGKSSDLVLQPEDILFVPSSVGKKVAVRTLDTAIQLGTGIVIWRR